MSPFPILQRQNLLQVELLHQSDSSVRRLIHLQPNYSTLCYMPHFAVLCYSTLFCSIYYTKLHSMPNHTILQYSILDNTILFYRSFQTMYFKEPPRQVIFLKAHQTIVIDRNMKKPYTFIINSNLKLYCTVQH